MNEGCITMTLHQQQRAQVLTQLLAGQLTQAEAAGLLTLSVRQVRRLSAAYLAQGPAALVHGNQGRAPAHALDPAVAQRVAALARSTYAGFNDQHLTEKLAEAEDLRLSWSTVRRLLRAAGQPSPRSRRPPQHRSRRERPPQAGMLLQADGSRHRWLGPDQPFLTLIGGIDDATGTVPAALFRAQEDAQGYLTWLWEVVRREGIPLALYVDRHGIFRANPKNKPSVAEQLAGQAQPTQFGRALAELGITPIFAQSPQAKGRIERLWGTFQDRLTSDLHLAGAQTLVDANRVLAVFLPAFNARFAVPAAQPGSAYRPAPADLALETVFCFKYSRVVAADNTVQFAQQRLQITPRPERASYARARVVVHERLDGSLGVYHQGQCLATQPAPADAPQLRARHTTRPSAEERPDAGPAPATAPTDAAPGAPLPAAQRRPGPRPPIPGINRSTIARGQSLQTT